MTDTTLLDTPRGVDLTLGEIQALMTSHTALIRVIDADDDSDAGFVTTLRAFLQANRDSLTVVDVAAILGTFTTGGCHHIGGGAAPLYRVEPES